MQNTKINTIALYGLGYVGKAFLAYAKKHVDIDFYDPKFDKRPPKHLKFCDAAVICVPTPTAEDGSCDTSIVEETVRNVEQDIVLIKSTVSPGTTERLAKETGKTILFSPEFISESSYNNPFYKTMADTPFIIMGGDKAAREAWMGFFQDIHGPTAKYFQCSSTEAELIKYTANAYSALKVTFVNEMYEIAKIFDADWHTIREGWLLDQRVEPMSTMVFPHKRGYSGKCLPKDVLALLTASHKAGYEAAFIREIHSSNLRFAAERLGEFLLSANRAHTSNEFLVEKTVKDNESTLFTPSFASKKSLATANK